MAITFLRGRPAITMHKRSHGGIRTDLKKYFRSSWEANYARYLTWLKGLGEIKDWAYESEVFEFKGIRHGCWFYKPDFSVILNNGKTELHEIKGYMDSKSKTKLKRMAKYFPLVKIVLVDKKHYYEIARKVGRLIGNWERNV